MRPIHRIKLFDSIYRFFCAWPWFYSNITQLFSIGQWERWQDHVFSDLSGRRVLEIGVGPGKLLVRMAKKGFSVTGIELRKDMAFEARKRVRDAGYEIDIIRKSAESLPFESGIFDAVVFTFVLAEIRHLDQVIIETRRVLKTGGKAIIIAGGMPKDRNFAARLILKMIQPQTSLLLDRDNKIMFERHGFRVSRTYFGPFGMIQKIIAQKA